MTEERNALREEIYRLADAFLHNAQTPETATRLEQLLCDNADARQDYIDYMNDAWLLRQMASVASPSESFADSSEWNANDSDSAIDADFSLIPVDASPRSPGCSSRHGRIASAWNGIGEYLSSHEVFTSYLTASILSLGVILIAMHIYIDTRGGNAGNRTATNNKASDSKRISPSESTDKSLASTAPSRQKKERLARIINRDNCRWKQGAARVDDDIASGDVLELESGLIEMVYDTGAHVVLQGPCKFTVTSPRSGYLGIGALTARVDKKSANNGKDNKSPDELAGVRQTPSTSPQSDNADSKPAALFSVSTPTAVVTDLGTEFGVEVGPNRQTCVYVFQGVVETSRESIRGKGGFCEKVFAGEAIRFASDSSDVKRTTVKALGVAPLVSGVVSHKSADLHCSRLVPTSLVASAYHRVWNAAGKKIADNDRHAAFRMVTDGVYGRGEKGDAPRSSFDTFSEDNSEVARNRSNPKKPGNIVALVEENNSTPHFAGLLYKQSVRIDRIKIFMGYQFSDGGNWQTMPRIFILKQNSDTDTASPESHPLVWQELPQSHVFYGNPFVSGKNPGEVLEFSLSGLPEKDREGFGWAVGGVPCGGTKGFLSITELRAYGEVLDKKTVPNEEPNEKSTQKVIHTK
jgi:hypothetical protein